jgi:hypothetical protein
VNYLRTVRLDSRPVLTLKDPDRRQYEMFYRVNHP